MEDLRGEFEAPNDRLAYERYLHDVGRGKSLLQLEAARAELTLELRQHWAPQSFTPIRTGRGTFDAVVCNVSYHFHKHGQRYGNLAAMTEAALLYFRRERHTAEFDNGQLRFPNGSRYLPTGQIVTFTGK